MLIIMEFYAKILKTQKVGHTNGLNKTNLEQIMRLDFNFENTIIATVHWQLILMGALFHFFFAIWGNKAELQQEILCTQVFSVIQQIISL